MGASKVILMDDDWVTTGVEITLSFAVPNYLIDNDGILSPRYPKLGEFYEDIESNIREIWAGRRPTFTLNWPAVDATERDTILEVVNHLPNNYQFYPDEDEALWFWCKRTDEDTENLLGQSGHRGPVFIIFQGIVPIDNIPSKPDGWYFCAVGEAGYSAAEISYFCDVEEGSYTSADNVTLFNSAGKIYAEVDGVTQLVAELY